jgi:serine/threonine protein kinase
MSRAVSGGTITSRAAEERLESQDRQLESLVSKFSDLDAKVSSLLSVDSRDQTPEDPVQRLTAEVKRLTAEVNQLKTENALRRIYLELPPVVALGHFRLGAAAFREGFGMWEGIHSRSNRAVSIQHWEQMSWLFPRTVFIQNQVNLPGVAKVTGWGTDPEGFFSVEEFGDHGSLDSLIRCYRQGGLPRGVNVTTLSKAILGVAATMSQCHSRELVHRSLNAECISITRSGEPLIGGFGNARFHSEELTLLERRICCDWYMAPELFEEDSTEPIVDVFAYGTLLFYLFADRPATLENERVCRTQRAFAHAIQCGFRFGRAPGIPDKFWEMIQACWGKPGSRPSFAEIVGIILNSNDFALPGTNLVEYQKYQEMIKRRLDGMHAEEFPSLRSQVDDLHTRYVEVVGDS